MGMAQAAKTHCPQGHPYSPENTYMDAGRRRCHKCRKRQHLESYHRRSKPEIGNLTIQEWRDENIARCKRCKQEVLRMPNDCCGWCDSPLPKRKVVVRAGNDRVGGAQL